jgi:hypothetical protein
MTVTKSLVMMNATLVMMMKKRVTKAGGRNG